MAFIQEGISQLDVKELTNIIQDQDSPQTILDVREIEEYIEGHIPSIPLIPMSEIIDVIDQFDKEKEYVFVCRSGRRSHEVAKFFKNSGIEKVHNFSGGMLSWDGDTTSGKENIIDNIQDFMKE